MNTELNEEEIKAMDYDTVILATGSKPKVFSLRDDSHIYTAEQVLLKQKDAGKKTVIVGGGLVGCETAL